MSNLDKLVEDISSSLSPYGDWKMIKYYEYLIRGITPPYSDEEMQEYFDRRDLIRQQIDDMKIELGLDGGTTPTGQIPDDNSEKPVPEPEPPIIEVD